MNWRVSDAARHPLGSGISQVLILSPVWFAVVETHPESLIDLRVHAPFPALVEYAKSFDFAAMNSQQHGHVPAVVILVQALESWRASVSRVGDT